jgi:hypothetical protein
MRRLLLSLALLPLLVGADPGERARVAAERQVLEARYAAEERACRERFVVTACVSDVRVRRRDALAPLRERELQLADSERRQRALERQAGLSAKRNAAPKEAPPAQLRLRPSPAASASVSVPPRQARREADAAEDRSAAAAERRRAAQRRSDDVAQTQARVERRVQERAAMRRKSTPLPQPGAGSAAAP